ncbi:ABC transporter substrate-binding protein [Vibrio chagasii]|jgi:tripartite-type tricarboxylate transporter receptor subunit TctC|uniref:tripartite tricarboxylate transporter substrate binding protein n=1 Tax=Vibrio TaxID=662 RepID=UPI00076AA820|nr:MULTISPECIES: tripartite tricarboxylate transporter substrate binding protein [Vibrio]CAH6980209.1 ABC transporter substrate-binding protein [Vibrio chagasii]NOI94368.1 tripartite tricarboxylate transporter substrate binding protein [Vibrio sp. T3Y01]PQJ56467.1 ABC transporter substrate-binding protein [Vibrio splendidus]CAH7084024.1 Tripartite tricarboxylate transporter substrate binding protein [Vibrio chagasii]CAH7196643.1 ABC transporter substrate-binding protein [Vibrio chagasii]
MSKLLKSIMLAAGILVSATSVAADYPSKNIRLVVPFGAGGGTDAVGRTLANSAKDVLGQNISIMNRTGGAGAVGMSFGAQQRADGYTLTVVTREIASLPQMGLMRHTADDFRLIRLVNLDPAVVLVAKDSPYNTINDLIKEARDNPGSVKFASTAAPNFYLMSLEKDQDIKLNAIPYNGASEAIPAVLGNHTDVTMVTPGEAIAQLRSGQLKALGVMSEERIQYIPDVPTLKEQGIDVVTGTWRGIGAPKNTPDEVVEKLGKAFDEAMASEEFKSFMAKGAMTIHNLDDKAFTEFVAEDTKSLTALIK